MTSQIGHEGVLPGGYVQAVPERIRHMRESALRRENEMQNLRALRRFLIDLSGSLALANPPIAGIM